VPQTDVRPTADRAREALFNSLGDLSGKVVWDLYSGTGALGLEALSRGAKFAGFVEREEEHCQIIEKNIAKVATAVPEAATLLVHGAVGRTPFQNPPPDFVFADPPYAASLAEFGKLLTLGNFRKWANSATIVWEVPDAPAGVLGEFLKLAPRNRKVRRFGGADFLLTKLES